MAWIDLTGLGRYHEKIKAWIEKNKYVHPANHPATMIVQDSLNQFVSKEQKDKWNNKLDADANAVSASKLYKAVKINGIEFDGSKDIEISGGSQSSLNYSEKSYYVLLEKDTTIINVPKENWEDAIIIHLFINGKKYINETNFTVDKLKHTITLKEPFSNKVDVEVLFISCGTLKEFNYILEKEIKEIPIDSGLNLTEQSLINIYADGIKLINNVHYTINYVAKNILLKEVYNTKTNIEIVIIKE